MLNLHTILVPTDFSGCADGAVNLALDLAKRHGASLHLLHVAGDDRGHDEPYGSHPVMAAWARAAALMPDAEVELAWGKTPVLAQNVRSHDVTQAILSSITRVGADLVIMGTHGHESVRRFLNDTPNTWGIGQTAQAVMAEVRCPVISVGPRASRSDTIECICAPVDLKANSALVAAHAGRLAESYSAPIELIHVVPIDSTSEYRGEQFRALKILGESVNLPERTTYRIVSGQPAMSIQKLLKGKTHCLVVMGSHGHTQRGDKQIGSAADALIRSAPCLVMTVRPYGSSLVTATPSAGRQPSWPDNLTITT